MGAAVSKTPKRVFPKTMPAQRVELVAPEQSAPTESQATGPVREHGIAVFAGPKWQRLGYDMQALAAKPSHDHDHEQDFLRQLKQEGIRDDELGSFLDKLGGAIAPKQVSTMDLKVSLQ